MTEAIMVAQKFSECFWNTEFNSNVGFDVLVRKMKEGRTSSKEIINFIKERSKIEEEYAKNLARLFRVSLGSADSGTFKDILNALKADTERASAVHQDMSQALAEQSQRIQQFKDGIATRCKQAEAEVKKLQAAKKDLYHKTQSSQQNYQKKCQAYETAQQTFASEKTNGMRPAKEIEKMESKAHKCKEERMKADDAYQLMVKNLETARVNWENEMDRACEIFQQEEQERLLFFRKELWVFVNIDSKTLGDQDEMNEEARNVMELSNPLKDIQDFIDAYQTGSTRPAPILYESGDAKATSKTLRVPKPPVPGSSTFFGADVRQPAALPAEIDEFSDPTYASVT